MKRCSVCIFIFLLCLSSRGLTQENPTPRIFSVASFNVHYMSQRHPDRLPWEERRQAVSAAINELQADIIGFQEVENWVGRGEFGENIQLQWILSQSAEYSAAAVGDPQVYPWTQPILYRPEKFTPITQGFFYFSETPDLIYSRPWDQSFPSYASWVQFINHQNNQSFRVVNVHFDHSSKANRHGAAELVSERISPWIETGEPVIVLGDFNAASWFKTIKILREAGLNLAEPKGSTFHFNRGLNLFPAIDHVLFSGFEQREETLRLNKKYGGVWPSDHYPIRVKLNMPPEEHSGQLAGNDGPGTGCRNAQEASETSC